MVGCRLHKEIFILGVAAFGVELSWTGISTASGEVSPLGRAINPSRNPGRARSKVVAGRVQQQHGGDQAHFELQALQTPETRTRVSAGLSTSGTLALAAASTAAQSMAGAASEALSFKFFAFTEPQVNSMQFITCINICT